MFGLSTKTIIIAVIVILVILLLVWIYYSGKKSGKQGKPVMLELPKKGADGEELQTVESQLVRKISTELYEDMSDTPIFTFRNAEAYRTFASMNDNLFLSTINDFNARYQGLGEGTLRDWLQDEVFSTGIREIVYDAILPRIASLNAVGTERVGSSLRRY